MPLLPLALAALAAAPGAVGSDKDPLLTALVEELDRSQRNLKGKSPDEPLYYLSYRLSDGSWFSDTASYGALANSVETKSPYAGRRRHLDVAVRVGSRQLDNTHKVRGGFSFDFDRFGGGAALPLEDDPGAIKAAIWRATDRAFKGAVKQLYRVKANKTVKVAEADQADDFSVENRPVSLGKRELPQIDRDAWTRRLERLSALFKAHPRILQSSVTLSGGGGTYYFVDTEGAKLRESRFFMRLSFTGGVRTEDGMDLELQDSFEARSPDQLPTEAQAAEKVQALIASLEALLKAPVVEPYSGPAIIRSRAAAVFFHEIFGHRIEGHRQKDADEGHTFTKKVNQKIVPEFISVHDDPTRTKFGEVVLNGHYQFDDEGVPAQKTPLVEAGVLKGFLQSRSPLVGFPKSNGHGRAQPGMQPVARQGNLMVESSKRLSEAELRAALIDEVKKRKKPYGLIFEDISGGFTFTRAGNLPQAFKVIPLMVRRVYPDGRPDELIRGVDIVGTPLQSFEKILATGDDYEVFNGYCGAESGWVPVSAVAPSLLVGEMEVEKKGKGHDRAPLLPPPPLSAGPSAVQKDPP
jgi:TldD protein